MLQILVNYVFIFIIPFIIGLIVRFFGRKFNKFYFITFGLAILTIILYFIVSNINTHGSEGPILRVMQLGSFTVGIAIVEVINYFQKKKK